MSKPFLGWLDVAKQPLLSLMRNNAVTGFRAMLDMKGPIMGDQKRTTQLLAHHPHDIADKTEKRGRKSDEN